MRIKFLGSGAADWTLANEGYSTEYRRLSACIIDGELLIDCGPQVIEALKEYQIDLSGIKYIINTHKHSDHFCEKTVNELMGFGAQYVEMTKGQSRRLGKYKVTAYAGNHGTCEDTVHFIISDSKNSLFYGLDGAWLLYDEFKAIKENQPDLAILDATIGFVDGDYRIFEHNNLNMVLEMKKTLSPYVKQFCISHMAFTLHTDHKALKKAMDEHNILVACDGLEIELM